MNSVEALTDRPTSDPGVNGIMRALVYHGLGQRKWETRAISCITACGICDFCRRGTRPGVTR